jgi:hypothetical protein
MFRSARSHDRRPEVTPPDRVRREPLPSARAILWKPLPDSYHLLASMMRTTEEQVHLYITQRAFLQVERHLRSAPELELGGFLAGHVCECPRSKTRYTVVNTVVPFVDVTGDALGSRVTQKAHDAVRRRLDAHGLSLIGWYRNDAGLGLQLLPDDVDTHASYFDEPWQTAMLVVPDPAKSKGAFFTYDPRVGRSYCIPFYELFDNHAADANRLNRTCVSWTTYVPSVTVQPLAVADREVVETTVAPMRSVPEPEPLQPIDEWLEAIKDPWVRLKDAAVAATRREVSTAVAPATSPMRARPTPERIIEAVPRAPASKRVHRVRDEDTEPLQAAVAAPRAPAPPPRPTPPARSAPRKDTDAPIRPRPPAVALPPNFHEEALRWQRRRRIGMTVAALSFLGAIALSTVRSRASRVAQAAIPAAGAPRAEIAAVPTTGGAVITSLAPVVDSLSGALAYYRDIAGDHREGLVGCRVLERAYALVARARTRVDSTRGHIAGALNDADSIRVSMLGAEYTHVAQTYRRSGCQA